MILKKENANQRMVKWINGISNLNTMKEEENVDNPIIIKIPKVDDWTITDLRYTCKKNKVKGYTKMSREQLIIKVNSIIKNH